jgi:protein subunit release factor A
LNLEDINDIRQQIEKLKSEYFDLKVSLEEACDEFTEDLIEDKINSFKSKIKALQERLQQLMTRKDS